MQKQLSFMYDSFAKHWSCLILNFYFYPSYNCGLIYYICIYCVIGYSFDEKIKLVYQLKMLFVLRVKKERAHWASLRMFVNDKIGFAFFSVLLLFLSFSCTSLSGFCNETTGRVRKSLNRKMKYRFQDITVRFIFIKIDLKLTSRHQVPP